MSQPELNPQESDRPSPGPGQIFRTPIPDSFDGIRFEIGRLFEYIQDGHKDPTVIGTAQKIAELAAGTARQLGRKITPENSDLAWLEGIHAWCHDRFELVSNPTNAELLKTPGRMLRELEIPEAISMAMWEPIRDAMAKAAGKNRMV